ncbi:hypothetical protein [Clostridium sardiniense]|uniref:hypothetical protein n=1 Tax=Clostridium sardiniense TaxID=29369 RepID=UPI003D353BEA
MWIKTQDKKKLVEVTKVELQKAIGSKYKCAIIGTLKNSSFFSSEIIELGKYSSLEDANIELKNIEKCITEDKKLYSMG